MNELANIAGLQNLNTRPVSELEERDSMDLLRFGEFTLQNLDKINVILGKNGCGKSFLLRTIDANPAGNESIGQIKYVTPERGGSLVYDPGVDNNISQNPEWLINTRRRNRFDQFKQQSMAQYRNLELLSLREIEKNRELRLKLEFTFDTYIDKINNLLDVVEIRRSTTGFNIAQRSNGKEVAVDNISSGESELISLSIECLVFQKQALSNKPNKINLLLLDEPDMHLHPDLQFRFGSLLKAICLEGNIYTLIATHSTALLSVFCAEQYTRFAFMVPGQKNFSFKAIKEAHSRIIPIFGAHPLSNVFNEKPLLLVEGEDEERIWQQAVRTSNGKLRLYPCSVGGKSFLDEHENEAINIMTAVYDKAKAFSLRDGDGITDELADKPPIIRTRLNCYSSENMLLTDETLALMGANWDTVKKDIERWVCNNPEHPHFEAMSSFMKSSFDRRMTNIKVIRNDILGIVGCEKPWEVIVGKAIASIIDSSRQDYSDGKIALFLGKKTFENLLSRI